MGASARGRGIWVWALAAAAALVELGGCGDDTVAGYESACDDDAIGWVLELDGLPEVPPPAFAVECAEGWGHDAELREPSELLELPNASGGPPLVTHDGLVFHPSLESERWTERLGAEVSQGSLLAVDERGEQLRWLRDDMSYGRAEVVATDAGEQLWVHGRDGEGEYIVALDPKTGATIEQVEWPFDLRPKDPVAAWPEHKGVWFAHRESYTDDEAIHGLYRMASLGEIEGPLRTISVPKTECCTWLVRLHPTPDGGILWAIPGTFERLDETGALLWSADLPHLFLAVDDHDSFLVGGLLADHDSYLAEGELVDPNNPYQGLALERRSLADGSLIWSRTHHRYEFGAPPEAGEFLHDTQWSHLARAGGGYLVAGGHSYPAPGCPWQPTIWAISAAGELEWAHRVETCGELHVLPGPEPGGLVDEHAFVFGAAYSDGVPDHSNTDARWLQRFEL